MLPFLSRAVGVLTLLPLLLATAHADDWPQWRGPDRTGISREKNLLQTWPKDGPKRLWQVTDLGYGFSTPAIAGSRLFVLSNDGTEREFVQARSVADGKPLWRTVLGKVGNPDQQPSYPGARSTPTIDGSRLYALSSDGDLACLDTATGALRWKKNLRTDFGGQPGVWAYSESPLVLGDALICTPGGSEATVVALNKNTGAVLWKSVAPEADQAAYSSPVVASIGGVRQIVQFLQKGVVGIDAATGKLLWRFDKTADVRTGGNIATPVVFENGVYSAAQLVGGGLTRVRKTDGAFTTDATYFSRKVPTGMGGAIRIGNYLYGTSGAALLCVEFGTGTVVWQDRCVGAASLCAADGLLIVRGETGEVALVEATPAGYRERGRFSPPQPTDRARTQAWTYPVIANGKLYLRDLETLGCYDIGGR